MTALALVERERERDPAAVLVVERDGHRSDSKISRTFSPTSVDDGLEIELSRECVADLVDDRQLGIAFARLLDGPRAAERGRDVLADERQEIAVVVGVARIGRVGLDDDAPSV